MANKQKNQKAELKSIAKASGVKLKNVDAEVGKVMSEAEKEAEAARKRSEASKKAAATVKARKKAEKEAALKAELKAKLNVARISRKMSTRMRIRNLVSNLKAAGIIESKAQMKANSNGKAHSALWLMRSRLDSHNQQRFDELSRGAGVCYDNCQKVAAA